MTVIFRQLPDIHTEADLERYGLCLYGRFGLLPDGSLWIGNLQSSHPKELIVGWYWGLSYQEELILSSRSIGDEVELLQGEGNIILKHFVHELVRQGLITRRQERDVV